MKKMISLFVLAGVLGINPLGAFANDESNDMDAICASFMSKGEELASARYRLQDEEARLKFAAGKSVDTVCLTLITWEDDGDFLFFAYEGSDDKPNVYQKKVWQVANKVVNKNPMKICLDVSDKSYAFGLYRLRNGTVGPMADIIINGSNNDTDVTSFDFGISGAKECTTGLCQKLLQSVPE